MSPRALATLNGLVLVAALLTATTGAGVQTEAVAAAATPAEQVAEPAAATAPAPEPVLPGPVETAPVETTPPAPTPTTPPPAAPAAEPTPPPVPRTVTSTSWAPYATVGPVTLHAPVDVVEAIGFHQSGHDGAQPQSLLPGPVRAGLLDQRGRDTHPQGAADIVVDPSLEVRAPVTGTVLRAGTYRLYCKHADHHLVIEPDDRPGWEVKLLHFEGLRVAAGQRVEAGVTVVGSGGRVLPFRSQVDKHTAEPSWPHLHLEVVDPSVPNRPKGPGCP